MPKTILAVATLLTSFIVAPVSAETPSPKTSEAIFAGGCFWCTESDFEKVKGVLSAESGYIGGKEEQPTYPQVSSGVTGHTEAVRVVYDPQQVSYPDLLYVFWRSIDPTVENRQFCDRGAQYRSGIFYNSSEQQQAAEDSLKTLQQSGRFAKIYTELTEAGTFWPAEEYHQDYYKKNPIRYNFYRTRCGRDSRLEDLWGKEAGTHPASMSKNS
ncbi:peptide-methionine (S)-S-oxide reductase MsrA [Parendozoicomonas haliclonae]|uniref:Peptide methionine sulfoxide reductase MsrA n=1 Tax=Parendozoicomonas haliclonae TaxID=1960125 RepID=A0A1X7AHI3_9GAMM|nr:peptide-methionine (S)-S-oxide reductase MsrA [Parendozoicomonas haliclonae]SMA42888.1 Peptide methionine sulfoxide reductase MsrA [Parendozoicomonas haliclonae]